MGLNSEIAELLEQEVVDEAEVESDGLYGVFLEKFSFDGMGMDGKPREAAKPKKEPTLQEHDKQHHPHGFDPETMTCKFREKMKKMTAADAADLIYATSDIHHSGIEDITDKEAGTIVLAGDFMEKAKKKEDIKDAEKWWEKKFLPWCEDHKDQQIVIIGGNCDKWLYYNRKFLEWPKNVHYLDDTATEVNGMKMYGTSWCPHNMNGAWEVDDDVLEKEFSKIPEGLDILVTHVPPKGEGLDLDHDAKFNDHFGSEALTKAILEKKPKIVLCGHVHSGSHKPVKIGDSLVMNVSRIDDDRYEKSFHGRRIGVERTDNGIGFLVDMDSDGRIELGKQEDIPSPIIALRDALREVAKSINAHIDSKDYNPNSDKVAKAIEAIEAARGEMEKFNHPKRRMLEGAIKEFEDSQSKGFTEPLRRIGKLFKGDKNGEKPQKFHFSWEDGHHGDGGMSSGKSYTDTIADYWAGFGIKPYSSYTNKYGKYQDPWKGGANASKLFAEGDLKGVEEYEDDPFDEFGLPKKK